MKFTAQLLAPLRSNPDRLIAMICQQAEQLLALQTENQTLRQQNQIWQHEVESGRADLRTKNARVVELEEQLATAQSKAARQAAPFRRPDQATDILIWRNLGGYQFVDQAQVGPRKDHFRRR